MNKSAQAAQRAKTKEDTVATYEQSLEQLRTALTAYCQQQHDIAFEECAVSAPLLSAEDKSGAQLTIYKLSRPEEPRTFIVYACPPGTYFVPNSTPAVADYAEGGFLWAKEDDSEADDWISPAPSTFTEHADWQRLVHRAERYFKANI